MVAVGAAYADDDYDVFWLDMYFVDDCMMGMSPNMMMYDLHVYDIIGLRTCVLRIPVIFLLFIVERSNYGAMLTLVCRV